MDDADAGAELLHAPLTIEYGFMRTTGPVIGAFLTGLREWRVFGIRGADGRVVCPPVEYDPSTGAPLVDLVEVGTDGTITSWSWVAEPRAEQLLDEPYALALIRLDGADTALLHAVDTDGDPSAIATGTRVKIRWRPVRPAGEEVADDGPRYREGHILDIECFELEGDA